MHPIRYSLDTITPIERYEAPALLELGTFGEKTLAGCLFNKQLGGSDGFTFMGISVPISTCSS